MQMVHNIGTRMGKPHREGDKPAVIRADGTQHWYKDGIQYTPGN